MNLRPMSTHVRTWIAKRERVLPCELERAHVARRCDLASVEDLDDVELRHDALENRSAEVTAPVAAEGMRNVGQPALLVDEIDAVIGRETRRDLLLEVQADELAVGGRDLFADDDLKTGAHLPKP